MEETDITYHAVEKDGMVTAIWEMQGRKHVRTIDPRSDEGKRILQSYTADETGEHEHANTQVAGQNESQ